MPLPEQFGTAVLPMCSAFTHGAAAPIKAITRLATSTTLWSYSMYAGGNTSYFRMGDFANAALPRSVCSNGDCNPYTSIFTNTRPLAMSATTSLSGPIVGTIVDALENVVSGVPPSRQHAVDAPAAAARALARKAAVRAAGLSGALALPPGLLGMLTVLPDLVAIWRIQAQLVSDIAGLYGKDLQLTRSHMVYCLFRHAATQFTRDVVVRTGQRLVVRQLSGGALKSLLTSIGMTVTRRVAGTAASPWGPVIGAAAAAAYAYYH